ncbi:MAG: glycosyltransferase [Flavobacteriaceae bacterium]|nr:glycosyltransferase [Flavobacteriaceae bacterium]MDG2502931.1 glycosyltransferase [Flavobacteriaceae bacterium]
MVETVLDYLFIGPVHPFRGGISETQHELTKTLMEQGFNVKLFTFTSLYPKILFPGSSPYSSQKAPKNLDIEQKIHAYSPLGWKKIADQINTLQPKNVIFRYYTPFLAPVYTSIAKRLDMGIKKIALVDNWFPHESNIWDKALNRFFGKQMQGFTTLSTQVAQQLKLEFKVPIWSGFHPIATHLHPEIEQQKAKEILEWSPSEKTILFFGLIRKYKGLELLIQSFAESPLKEENIRLYIAGECYENPNKYSNLIKDLQLENRITLDLTFKNTEETALLFSAADAVAQTYHTATQSGVTPYAYFYNKPLLVSDIPGLREVIKKDNTGVCSSKNPSSIASQLIKLLDTENTTKYQKNIEKVKGHYQWSSFAEKWHHFIEKI